MTHHPENSDEESVFRLCRSGSWLVLVLVLFFFVKKMVAGDRPRYRSDRAADEESHPSPDDFSDQTHCNYLFI